MKLTLVGKKLETGNVHTFIFKPDRKISWLAGQYLIYSLPHQREDLRGRQRFFTISSAPYQKFPSITTRIEKTPSSFKNALDSLKIGGQILAKGPDGDFIVENSKEKVFIAGGIGITPFIALLRNLKLKKGRDKITLLYGNRSNNILFKSELDEIAKSLRIDIRYIVSPNKIDRNMLKNFIDKKIMYYVSGPDPMVERIEKILSGFKIKDGNIKLDYFSGYKKI